MKKISLVLIMGLAVFSVSLAPANAAPTHKSESTFVKGNKHQTEVQEPADSTTYEAEEWYDSAHKYYKPSKPTF